MSDKIRNERGQFTPVQETPERETETLNTETTDQPTTQRSTSYPSITQAQHRTSPLSIGIADTSRKTATATVVLASYAKSEVAIFLQGLIKQGIIIEGHATYLLDIYVFM